MKEKNTASIDPRCGASGCIPGESPSKILLVRLLAFFILVSCFQWDKAPGFAGDEPKPVARPGIFVSILPLQFFVARISGDLVDLQVLVGPGMSPATYDPLPRQMAALSRARLLFTIGVPFERRLLSKLRDTMPDLKVIDAGAGIAGTGETLETSGHHDDHNEHRDCSSESMDPHVWMSPVSARVIARNIFEGLVALLPNFAEELRSRFEILDADLVELHREIGKTLAPFAGKAFFVYHPAYGHFASVYGLKQISVEVDGKEPSPRSLAKLVRLAGKEGVRVIFAQPQFSTFSVAALARSIDGRVVTLDPLSADYLQNLRSIARALAGLEESGGGVR